MSNRGLKFKIKVTNGRKDIRVYHTETEAERDERIRRNSLVTVFLVLSVSLLSSLWLGEFSLAAGLVSLIGVIAFPIVSYVVKDIKEKSED